jgi:L-rhamnose mutarotase
MSDRQRYGKVIGIREEKLDDYLDLHSNVWPEVESMIKQCNMENFNIFVRKLPDGKHYLFMYFEYTGTDIDADNAKMAADPKTQEWWAICEPCQKPLADREEGEWWADMDEAYYLA